MILADKINDLIKDDNQLRIMGERARKIGNPNAIEMISKEIQKLV